MDCSSYSIDGYVNRTVNQRFCEPSSSSWLSRDGACSGSSFYADGFDCQDSDVSIYPGASEVCNYVDDSCVDPEMNDKLTGDGVCTANGVSACEDSVDCGFYNVSAYPISPERATNQKPEGNAPGLLCQTGIEALKGRKTITVAMP